MRTEKQIKAQRRNFTLMYLSGVMKMLFYLSKLIISPYIKSDLLRIRYAIEAVRHRISVLEDYSTNFYGGPNLNLTQKDVKNECKNSNQCVDSTRMGLCSQKEQSTNSI